MTRLSLFFVAVVIVAGGGCGGKAPSLVAEKEDSDFQEAQQLETRGEPQKALIAYQRVIAKRGEDFAPESQLGAALLEMKSDPWEAAYRLRKYIWLQPNSPRADLARAQADAARRDILMTYIGQPALTTDTSALQSRIDTLTKENAELKAALATGRPATVSTLTLSQKTVGTPAPEPATIAIDQARNVVPTVPIGTSVLPSAPAAAVASQPAPKTNSPAPSTQKPTAQKPQQSGKTYTVVAGDNLFAVARKNYGGNGTNAQATAIQEANRDLLPTMNSQLKVGMLLKIP